MLIIDLLQQLKRSEKRWMQPSEVAKEGSEEEHETEVSSIFWGMLW